jgi:multiple sugar transport system substrate-binding protein
MRKFMYILTALVVLSMVLTACGAPATSAPAEEPAVEEAPATEAAAEAESPSTEGPIEIRWFIGLGAGGNPEEVEKEQAFVDEFNAKYGDKYKLVMDVVQNATAYDVLKTQIASGDVPDIVGPVGVRGLWSFEGAWMDLAPFVEKTGYDISDFNPALIDFYKLGPQGQVGLPFAIYPSALWYNKDLFDEAGIAYPPHKYGEAYADGDPWDFDKVRELGLQLTFDANGNAPDSPDFDPENIVQFGYDAMWTDIRGKWTFFEAGSFVGADGSAVMPDVWREAAHWYYDGMWSDYFIPNDNYVNSDLLAQGNTFSSGNVAMTPIHTWYTCCAGEVNWDLAAIPTYDGHTTAKMHADTFAILKGNKNPDAAFEVLTIMLGDMAPQLLQVYGAFPARQSLQDSALEKMKENFPNADLQVFIDSISYPDNPNHESGMPNFLKSSDTYTAFASLIQTTPGLDLDAEIDKLITDLDAVFKEQE